MPYVRMPAGLTPGEPLRFATALPLSGFGRGVVVTSIDGRPIKVEGNPQHPASLGATDVFAEASVLSLYDPDRSRAILHDGHIVSPNAFRQAVRTQFSDARELRGEGFALLTGPISSPTLLRQIDDLLAAFPKAGWYAHDPIDDQNARTGAVMAFRRPFRTVPRLENVRVLVSLDADPLGHGPDQLRNARGFAQSRKPGGSGALRVYSAEALPTLTGAKADHRIALRPDLIGEFTIAIARALGAGCRDASLPDHALWIARQAAADLASHRGAAMVLTGRTQSAEIHALAHWINAQLQAPVDHVETEATPKGRQPGTLADLARRLAGRTVDQLVIIDANPSYDAPADLDFGRHMANAAFRLHLGGYADETATLCNWHLPRTHALEAWSDLRASDGSASLAQPLIRPLFDGWTDHQLVALLAGREATAYDLVRETWRPLAGDDFAAWWMKTLHDGVVASDNPGPVAPAQPALPDLPNPASNATPMLVLQPDPGVWDGAAANNAWLQECPKPLTKQVWGNSLALNPREAGRLTLASGDVVAVIAGDRRVETVVHVEPGVADGVVGLTLGYGRTRAGAIGNGIGCNAYALRTAIHPWVIPNISIEKTGRRDEILTTQSVVRNPHDVRELFPLNDLSETASAPATTEPPPSLLPKTPQSGDRYAWAMVIDTAVCIGCNACVISCQAENNVPVVGPEEVARGRDMHWLRVDVYDHGTTENPEPGFQPVPCMHCEQAPCEPVCPVAASVHDSEGLNLQVYNRCVGTRFCEANCPYKVRRFNFFGYADGQEYANLGFDSYRAQKNPEVTVRARGVMEKCTYCIQRISDARRAAERDDRPIGPDDVRTACQNACPTQAITFGNVHETDSEVSHKKRDPRHYVLLEHLGTRPRTTYLSDIKNPAPGLRGDST